LGYGGWAWGEGPNPHPPIPNPQSPIPNPQSPIPKTLELDNLYFNLLMLYILELKKIKKIKMLENFIKYLDLIGPKPKLMTESKSRFKTIFGGLFTMTISLAILALSIYFSISLFSRNKISLISNQVQDISFQYQIFKIPYLMLITDNTGASIENSDNLYSMRGLYWYANTTTNRFNIIPLKLINCQKNFKELWPIYNKLFNLNESFICIDPNDENIRNKTIYGAYGDVVQGSSSMSIYINKCINDTKANKTNCATKELIDKTFETAFFSILTVDYEINNYNVTDPGIPFVRVITNRISSTIFKRFAINVGSIEYNTDVGYMFQDIIAKKFTRFESYSESVDNRAEGIFPGNFAVFSIQSSTNKFSVFRSYMKIQDLIANIGGVVKGITFFSTLIQNYFVSTYYTIKLINDLNIDTSKKTSDLKSIINKDQSFAKLSDNKESKQISGNNEYSYEMKTIKEIPSLPKIVNNFLSANTNANLNAVVSSSNKKEIRFKIKS
jgi:hypothetical protein